MTEEDLPSLSVLGFATRPAMWHRASMRPRSPCARRRTCEGLMAMNTQPPHPSRASGEGASRPLSSGSPAKQDLSANPLASVERSVTASSLSPSDGLRPTSTRPRNRDLHTMRPTCPGDVFVAFYTKRRGIDECHKKCRKTILRRSMIGLLKWSSKLLLRFVLSRPDACDAQLTSDMPLPSGSC